MNSAKKINAKFKILRRNLKNWAKNLPCLKNLIKKVNETIELLDIFEELRPLTLEEWNLRDLLKSHIISLLQNQRVYWKQRGKIKWVKLGNENTRFFHSKATITDIIISASFQLVTLRKSQIMKVKLPSFGKPSKTEWANVKNQKFSLIWMKFMDKAIMKIFCIPWRFLSLSKKLRK
jgi:hypothetical protein